MAKEKVSVSIDENILKKLQQQIKNNRFRSLSEAFEIYITKGLLRSGINSAVLLIKQRDFPILLQEYKGKPLIENHLSFFVKNKIQHAYIITGFCEEASRLAQTIDQPGLKVSFIYEDGEEGNVSALKKVKKFLDEPFLLLSGDTYFSFDISKIAERHISGNAIVTVGLYGDKPQKTSSVIVLDGDEIKSYRKGETKNSLIIDIGLYIVHPDIFGIFESSDRVLEQDVFPRLCALGQMKGYFIYGEHKHLGPE